MTVSNNDRPPLFEKRTPREKREPHPHEGAILIVFLMFMTAVTLIVIALTTRGA